MRPRPPTKVEQFYLALTEVNDFGEVRHEKATVRRAIVTVSKTFDSGIGSSIGLKFDTGAFEHAPTFTFDLGDNGPRLYIHGTVGELAKVIEIMDDGSIRVETHE